MLRSLSGSNEGSTVDSGDGSYSQSGTGDSFTSVDKLTQWLDETPSTEDSEWRIKVETEQKALVFSCRRSSLQLSSSFGRKKVTVEGSYKWDIPLPVPAAEMIHVVQAFMRHADQCSDAEAKAEAEILVYDSRKGIKEFCLLSGMRI